MEDEVLFARDVTVGLTFAAWRTLVEDAMRRGISVDDWLTEALLLRISETEAVQEKVESFTLPPDIALDL